MKKTKKLKNDFNSKYEKSSRKTTALTLSTCKIKLQNNCLLLVVEEWKQMKVVNPLY